MRRNVGAYQDDEDHFAATVAGLEVRLNDLTGCTSTDPEIARLRGSPAGRVD